MPGDAQRRVARCITAFLEGTLLDQAGALEGLNDERRARRWRPEDVNVTRFDDSLWRTIANDEEDADLTTATLSGARIEQHGLSLGRQRYLPLQSGTAQDTVVHLGWQPTTRHGASPWPPSYAIHLPLGLGVAWGHSGGAELRFALAPVDEQPSDDGAPGADRNGASGSAPAGSGTDEVAPATSVAASTVERPSGPGGVGVE
jgi:hypothetical protein